MGTFAVDEYVRAYAAADQAMNDWTKVSWGIFFGCVLAGIVLGPLDRPGPAASFVTVAGIVLLVLHRWRSHRLHANVHRMYLVLTVEERRAATDRILQRTTRAVAGSS